jgi:hypothetical protein
MSREHLLGSLSDDELLRRLTALMDQHRQIESEVVAHISEVDERKLYLGEGCSSMHAYCTEVLHLSSNLPNSARAESTCLLRGRPQ